MPFALLIAFVLSLGLHVAALFLTDVEVSDEPETRPLIAELKPLPPPVEQKPVLAAPAEQPKDLAKPKPQKKKKKSIPPEIEFQDKRFK